MCCAVPTCLRPRAAKVIALLTAPGVCADTTVTTTDRHRLTAAALARRSRHSGTADWLAEHAERGLGSGSDLAATQVSGPPGPNAVSEIDGEVVGILDGDSEGRVMHRVATPTGSETGSATAAAMATALEIVTVTATATSSALR